MRPTIPLLPTTLRWAGVLAIAMGIVYFSLLDSTTIPNSVSFWDKRLHLASYGTLTLSLVYATVRRGLTTRQRLFIVVGLAMLLGIVIELLQGPLADRHFSYGDILANLAGSVVASGWLVIERHVDYVPVVT